MSFQKIVNTNKEVLQSFPLYSTRYIVSMTSLQYIHTLSYIHCEQDPIYVFPEMQLRDLVPNFHIHVSVSDL
jgi:hypothetical protein